MKKILIITAVVLVAIGLILFGVATIASDLDFSKLDTTKYETNTYMPSEDFETIVIKSNEADITFRPSVDGKVQVDCFEREKVRHEVSVENGTLKIIAVDNREVFDHLVLFSLKEQSVTVYLPSEHYAALTIVTSTGDVSVPGIFSFGEAQITTSTGDVSFDASSDGALKIRTSTGDIGVSGVCADSINLSVSTGKIICENIDCKKTLSVNVGTGKTVLTDVECRELLSNGNTGSLRMKKVIAGDDFNIERTTGDVRFENCDAGQITVKTSTGDVTGTLCSSKVFITKTSTGDISVPDTVSGGRCEITTSTGDIEIEINK